MRERASAGCDTIDWMEGDAERLRIRRAASTPSLSQFGQTFAP